MDFCFTQAESWLREINFFISGKIPLLIVPMIVLVFVVVNAHARGRGDDGRVRMIMVMCMAVFVLVVMREVDIKLHAGDGGFLPVRNVQMIAVELEFLQLTFEFGGVHAEIEQARR
jgi:hypothetical protein